MNQLKYADIKQALLLLSKEDKDNLSQLKSKDNIIGLSGGKDSMATCIILHWIGIPFRTITAEVRWKEVITGENPYHYDFLHEKVFPKLKSWGVEYHTVRSDITAYDYMTTPIVRSKHRDRIGKLRGFPLCGKCGIQRDCKTKPCENFYKEQKREYTAILGIAHDEKDRILTNNANNRISILNLLRLTEFETFPICEQEKLLSPTYFFSHRGGCWFCPNQKIQELELTYRLFHNLWDELMEIQNMPNKVQEKFNRTQTLYDIENQIKAGVQQKWFIGHLIQGGDT